MTRKLPQSIDWTFEQLQEYDEVIADYAHNWLGLDTYENQIEVINSSQMLDAYSSNGLPVFYKHWSFGKRFIQQQQAYQKGDMGLAYEIVINSNPCIAYLMEENTLPMQSLVIAHACSGHNAVFKNNYLFRERTRASDIIDYLLFAKDYIEQCEQKYGFKRVETFIDSCHALMHHGVSKNTARKKSPQEQVNDTIENENFLQQHANELWEKTIPQKMEEKEQKGEKANFPSQPQENMLYFFEKNAPLLEPWQREILRIVRKQAEYFYPQMQTKTLNEGFATFTHYNIMNKLYDDGWVDEGFLIEVLASHCNVIYQPPFHSKFFSGMNPYALGFAIFNDIKRICTNPTPEDERFFPSLIGKNWIEVTYDIMKNYRDDNFIMQFLSPKVMRDFGFFAIERDQQKSNLTVSDIHDDEGFQHIKSALSTDHDINMKLPSLEIIDVDIYGDRKLTIKHNAYNGVLLNDTTVEQTLPHIANIWGFDVEILSTEPVSQNIYRGYYYNLKTHQVLINNYSNN